MVVRFGGAGGRGGRGLLGGHRGPRLKGTRSTTSGGCLNRPTRAAPHLRASCRQRVSSGVAVASHPGVPQRVERPGDAVVPRREHFWSRPAQELAVAADLEPRKHPSRPRIHRRVPEGAGRPARGSCQITYCSTSLIPLPDDVRCFQSQLANFSNRSSPSSSVPAGSPSTLFRTRYAWSWIAWDRRRISGSPSSLSPASSSGLRRTRSSGAQSSRVRRMKSIISADACQSRTTAKKGASPLPPLSLCSRATISTTPTSWWAIRSS